MILRSEKEISMICFVVFPNLAEYVSLHFILTLYLKINIYYCMTLCEIIAPMKLGFPSYERFENIIYYVLIGLLFRLNQ